MRSFACFWLMFSLFFVNIQQGLAQYRGQQFDCKSETWPLKEILHFTRYDSLRFRQIPELILPKSYHNQPLPEMVDNSQQPWFRPILGQSGFECSQTTGVAYTFTYEINRLRNLPSDAIENQYPTHFVFNWYNRGIGAANSFFDSWEIIRAAGTPTLTEYGGTPDYGGDRRWMNGYDLYYSAMKNRLHDFFSISLKNVDGLLTLKHWINDHLNDSETGGVASIYCAYSALNHQLPQGTPEAGKFVLTELVSPANHAVCIVGYHDSIRWDYNGDGQFTNHLDINNDGFVDFRDWEIGGVKIANSYPMTQFGDFGFAYLTYNALCRSQAQNGIWNQAANVIEAKENTNPQLTFKITLTHEKRCNIKIMAGVSAQPGAVEPEYVTSFPVFNYQGGPYFMQGGTSEQDKTLEFGLDVTPLLGYVQPDNEATFFLLVDEDDPGNSSTGYINCWSVMDYTNGLNEIPYSQTNIPIIENSLTLLSLVATINFVRPDVMDDSLPAATVNEPYEKQMTGTSGVEPYRWWLQQNYNYSYSNVNFQEITTEELFPNGTNAGYAEKEIDFSFPFYDKSYNNFYIHTDGYLMVEENELPWVFVVEDLTLLKNLICIAPYMARVLGTEGGGMWYEGNNEKATFRWEAIENGTGNVVNFAVSLFPSGKIEFHYGNIAFAAWNHWYAGISNGDGCNFEILNISDTFGLEPNLQATLEPEFGFTEMALSRDGLFEGTPGKVYNETPVSFFIQDANGLQNVKTLPFTTDKINRIIIAGITVEAGNDSIIEYGEHASLSVKLTNLTSQVVESNRMKIAVQNEFVTLTDSMLTLVSFNPGETKTFDSAFIFHLSSNIPDNFPIVFDSEILTPDETFESHINLLAHSPVLSVAGYSLADGNNNYPEPGDTISLSVQLKNAGGAKAKQIMVSLHGSNQWINIIQDETAIDSIGRYEAREASFTFSVDGMAPMDFPILFRVEAMADSGFNAEKTIVIQVGSVMDDAETGDFTLIDWDFDGAAPWQIDQENPFEGQYCFKSGTIGHNSFSKMSVTMNVVSDGVITFYNKTSSQPDFDFLKFSIDNIVTGLWSGEMDYTQRIFPVKSGNRTFTWTYTKDHTIASGTDAAWVDQIVFPPCVEEKPVITAGADNTVCIDQFAPMEALAYLTNSYRWSTFGDGTFGSTNSLNTIYLPGPLDASAGQAQLALQATGTTGAILNDSLWIFIQDYPEVWAGNDTAICPDDDFLKVSGEASNVSLTLWLTSGDGTFVNPNNLNAWYYPGEIDHQAGIFTLTLIGFPVSPCQLGLNHSMLVTIEPLPVVVFDSVASLCNTAPPIHLTGGSPDGGIYSGPAVEEGWFYPSEAGVGSHILAYTYTNQTGCSNSAFREVTVVDCLGIKENQHGNLIITPNPGKGLFRIQQAFRFEHACLLTVYDIYGQKILNQYIETCTDSSIIIDLSNQPPGIYWVKLEGKNEVMTGKLVVGR